VLQVGSDWVLVRAGANDVLVPAHAVVGVEGAGPATAPEPTSPSTTMRWTAAWRVIARDRARVRVVRAGGSTVHGVPVRVGADFVELDPGRQAVAGPVLVPYAAITAAYVPRDRADGG
jgi:hypothetical protein